MEQGPKVGLGYDMTIEDIRHSPSTTRDYDHHSHENIVDVHQYV